jgi:hypothetical protein
MAHLQKGIGEEYLNIGKVSDMIRNAHSNGEIEGIWKNFIEKNFRGKEFHSKVGGVTDLTLHGNYAAVPELARVFSELNYSLRNEITKGRETPGMKMMSADTFDKSEIKKSVDEFFKQDILGDVHKATVALLEIRKGGFDPENTAELMRKLVVEYYRQEQPANLEGLIRSINANLASEYQELRGKLEGQDTFKRLNLA